MKLIKDLGVENVKNYRARFGLFKCSYCHNEVKRRTLNGKRDKSCGCNNLSILNDGLAKDNRRIHEIWSNMKTRCLNLNYYKAHRYSQRGITLCDEWYYFKNFLEWAKNSGYDDNLQIDRKDNNKGYCPENCQFTTAAGNAQNKECNTLSMKMARRIRRLKGSGLNNTEISKKLNVLRKSVSLINLNKQWVEPSFNLNIKSKIK